MTQLMDLLGLDIPSWAGPTLCESSTADFKPQPAVGLKVEAKREPKAEGKAEAVGLGVPKTEQSATGTKGGEQNSASDPAPGDGLPVKEEKAPGALANGAPPPAKRLKPSPECVEDGSAGGV